MFIRALKVKMRQGEKIFIMKYKRRKKIILISWEKRGGKELKKNCAKYLKMWIYNWMKARIMFWQNLVCYSYGCILIIIICFYFIFIFIVNIAS